MKQQEDWLRQACERLAQEETEKLESSLTRQDIREAEALFKQHKRKALALIGRNSKKSGRGMAYLRAAACLILVIGGVYFALTRSSPDPVPLSPGSTSSVAPYLTPSPTFSPVPTAPAPTATPYLETSPTVTAVFTEIPTVSPTFTPTPTVTPTFTPTPSPTETPPTPTPAPLIPGAWTGEYFPEWLPEGYEFVQLEQGEGSRSAVYALGDSRLIFTEYDAADAVPLPDAAERTDAPAYIQCGDTVALRVPTQNGTFISWSAQGRSFSLLTRADQPEEIVKSVKKILE